MALQDGEVECRHSVRGGRRFVTRGWKGEFEVWPGGCLFLRIGDMVAVGGGVIYFILCSVGRRGFEIGISRGDKRHVGGVGMGCSR